MSGSKAKGTRGEHEIEKILQKYGIRAFRNDQIFKGGKNNPDVSAEIAGIPLHIEVKRAERLNVVEAMHQAERDAAENALPVVTHRRNREKWLVTLPMLDLLDILSDRNIIHKEDEPQ